MSIFKGTLSPEIAAQLKARENVVESTVRKDKFLRYTTGKNSWVRMASFVNVNGSEALSKQWVLEGGVPYSADLRYGVARKEGVYANNLANNDKERPYGYRPMPGIVSISVSNKGAYGSLRQAVIRYQCWDRHQLDQLEKLYMRVGYTVLLEWGWSQYLNHKPAGKTGINSFPDDINIENFTDRPIDPFISWTEDGLYDTIDKNVSKYKGNYDAMVGYIQNFSWQLMPNGGFDCSTTLISRGEVLTEIKNSSNPYTIIDSGVNGIDYIKSTYDDSGVQQERAVLSLFEKIFLNIKAQLNQGELYDAKGEFYVKYDAAVSPSQRESNTLQIQNQVTASFQNIVTAVNGGTYKGYNNSTNTYYDRTYTAKFSTKTPSGNSNVGFLKPTDGKSDGAAIEYITFSDLIAILNTFFLPKNKKTKNPIVNIVIPTDTETLVCEDSVSIDPTTCLFTNPYASFITEYVGNDPDEPGFTPRFYELTPASYRAPLTASSFENPYIWTSNYVIPKGSSTNKHGDQIYTSNLGYLLISVSKIIEVYRRLMTSDGISIIDYLQALLEDISLALGGINDFKVYSNRNLIHIIDAKYLETSSSPDGSYDKKFKFNLIGLNSICRDVKINSRIFSEQASMIAIGAAASGEQQNIGDIYSTTQQAFNKGLTDRIISGTYITEEPSVTRTDSNGNSIDPKLNYYYDIYKNFLSIRDYLRRKVLGIPSAQYYNNVIDVVRIPSSEEIINTSSLLKSYLLQLDGKDLDFKALIPLELEITLDGISGFIIGQIFTIDESILPSAYANSKVGLIITGVSHTLQNNDWTTTLKTQMCLLDNDKIDNKLRISEKKKIKDIISSIAKQTKITSYLTLAMADYLTYLTIGILYVGDPNDGVLNKKENKLGLTETQKLPIRKIISTSYTDSYYMYIDPNSNFYDQVDLTLEAQKSVNGAVEKVAMIIAQDIPFYDSAKTGNSYLEKWYNIVKPLNLPDFPSTFNDLINAKDAGGAIVPLENDILMFNEEVIASASRTGNWGSINTALVKGNQVFFYKYLTSTPLKYLQGFQVSPGTNTPTSTTYENTNKTVIDLAINNLYLKYLKSDVANFINSRPNLLKYTDPRAYTTFYSLESGAAGTNVIWEDGYKVYTPPAL